MLRFSRWPRVGAVVLALLASGCSLKQMAINRLGDALAAGNSSFAEDDDSELIADATPFALKTTEALLAQSPRHRGLLLAAASGFAQYAYAFIQQEADFVEDQDLSRATRLRDRARRLYLRSRDYGLRGLELDLPALRQRLRDDPPAALAGAKARHVPLLYWTGLAWFGAINLAKDDTALSADQYVAEALLRRALALDETYERGVLHDFFIVWEARSASVGGSPARAREHLERATSLSAGQRAYPYVVYAEFLCAPHQDRAGFKEALDRALAVDPAASPELRLTNTVMQRRARWLLSRADDLFLE
jgi:predicted anti-sigma-YlaC factor YlaD